MKNRIFVSTSKIAAGIGSLALISMLAGCGIGNVATTTSPVEGVTLGGMVHGGEQGVSGATVQLYTVGTGGYGSNATALGAPATTNQYGSWTIDKTSYGCPSSTTQVFILATGGNPGLASGTNNTAIQLAAGLGNCGNLSQATSIDINEITTIATAFSLGQYFGTTFALGANAANTAGDSFGSPNTTQAKVGLANAMLTIGNLVNVGNGTPIQAGSVTGAAGTLTTTPEYQKLSTMADIIASCVNTGGPSSNNCLTLFSDVTPTGGTQPSNTLEAAVYMSLYPLSTNSNGSHIADLFALETPTSPFQATGLTAAPNDWTMGILYSAPQTTTQTLINGVNGINIDSNGNVFIINYTSASGAATGATILSPTGAPVYTTTAFGTITTTSPNALALRQIAVDLNGTGYITSSSTGGGLLTFNAAGTTSNFTAGGQFYGVAVDGNNNVYVSHNSTSSNTFSFEDFQGGTITANSQYRFPFDASTLLNQTATILTNGSLVETAGSTARASALIASNINIGTCTPPGPCTATNDPTLSVTYNPVTLPASTAVYQTAAEKNGGFFAPNGATGVYYYNGATVTTYGTAASLGTSRHVAVDGANNAWVTDRASSGVSELTTAGTFLSPVTTTVGTTTTGSVGFVHTGITTGVNGIAIDPSGNVWLPTANQTATAPASNYSIFELVGAAAPTVTPLALALKNTSVGSRP